MTDDDGAEQGADEIEVALQRLFADTRREADGDVPGEVLAILDDAASVLVVTGRVHDIDAGMVDVRSASALGERQLLVHGTWTDVVLDIASIGDGFDVRGTVLEVDEPCAVQLLDGELEVALEVTDAFGEFALRGLAPGRYELVVAAGRAELSADIDVP